MFPYLLSEVSLSLILEFFSQLKQSESNKIFNAPLFVFKFQGKKWRKSSNFELTKMSYVVIVFSCGTCL